jgi:hypothetical protein
MAKSFWIVVCEGHPDTKFDNGMLPLVAFQFPIEQAAREYVETVKTSHQIAILIQVIDGISTVVN